MELTSETVSLISTGVKAAATIGGAVAQMGAAKAGAAADRESAEIARQQGAARADAIRRDAARMRGAQKSAIGGTGLRADAFADVIADSDYEAELDALTATYESTLQSRAYRQQADNDLEDAREAMFGGVVGAGAQAIGGYGAWKRDRALREAGVL